MFLLEMVEDRIRQDGRMERAHTRQEKLESRCLLCVIWSSRRLISCIVRSFELSPVARCRSYYLLLRLPRPVCAVVDAYLGLHYLSLNYPGLRLLYSQANRDSMLSRTVKMVVKWSEGTLLMATQATQLNSSLE